MKRAEIKISVFVIASLILIVGLTTASAVYYNQNDSVEDEVVEYDKSIRHTTIELDPKNYRVNVSKEEAKTIVNNIGYTSNGLDFELLKNKHWNKVYWRIDSISNDFLISVDADNGDILQIYDDGDTGPLDIDEDVDTENIRSAGVSIIDSLMNFPENSTEPHITVEKDDGKRFYTIGWNQSLNGIEVIDSRLSVCFTEKGHLNSLFNIWYHDLKEQNVDIPRDQVLSSAEKLIDELNLKDYLKKRIYYSKETKIDLIYKRPFFPLNESKPIYGEEIELVYSVEYLSKDGTVTLYIDAETGDYRGIDYSKYRSHRSTISKTDSDWIYYGIPILIGIIIGSYTIYQKERAQILKRKQYDKIEDKEEENWDDLLESVK